MTATTTEGTTPTTAPGIQPPTTDEFIDGLAELMAHSARTPILRWPDEYGLAYEDVFFPAQDGVTLEGWFIPAHSDRLIICNHPCRAIATGTQDTWNRGPTSADSRSTSSRSTRSCTTPATTS